MRTYPLTIQEARALPELTRDHYLLNRQEFEPLSDLGIGGDSIICFQDADGTSKSVVDFNEKIYKSEFDIPLLC